MNRILNPLELREQLKQEKKYNYRTFITLNGHNIEKYVREVIIKQLKKKCVVNHSYNQKFDLLLYYHNQKFSIEVKSCKRFITNSNDSYTRNGNFKFGIKIFDNKPKIIALCVYYRKFRKVYFCYGKDVLRYLKNKTKRKKPYYNISVKQMFQNLKPKENIRKIIEKVNIYG